MKKKMTFRQIMAIAGIVVLVGLYIASLILAFVNKDKALMMLKLSIAFTIVLPVLIYIMLMFAKLTQRADAPEEKVYADEKDDPFTDKDFEEDNK